LTQKIMSNPEMMRKIHAGGAEPAFNRPEEFQASLRKELVFWQQVAKTMPQLIQK